MSPETSFQIDRTGKEIGIVHQESNCAFPDRLPALLFQAEGRRLSAHCLQFSEKKRKYVLFAYLFDAQNGLQEAAI